MIKGDRLILVDHGELCDQCTLYKVVPGVHTQLNTKHEEESNRTIGSENESAK